MSEDYDAIVVGSGAGGSMTAWALSRAGLKVCMLEAGRDYDPIAETPMLNWNRDAPLAGSGTPEQIWNYYGATVGGGWEVPGEPYNAAEGSKFLWFRTRMLGGRVNHWGRNSYRMGPYDFKAKSRDGLGTDWPIEYSDLKPWYDKVEGMLGVYGSNTGLDNHPSSPEDVLHKPPKFRITEMMLKAAASTLGVPVENSRRMILTANMDNRLACYYASACFRGCSIGAAFQPTTSLIPWALETGNLTIKTDAFVYRVALNSQGEASGVRYIDGNSGARHRINGKCVILAASTGETAKILLNSKSPSHPDGLGNSNGHVGKHLADTVGARMKAQFPILEGRPNYNEDGAMGNHAYIPFWLYEDQLNGKLDFPRGYHIEINGQGRKEPDYGLGGVFDMLDGYGADLRNEVNRYYGTFLDFDMRGEKVPNSGCYVELNQDVKDKWGLPTLKFHYQHSDYEHAQIRHFQSTVEGIVEKLGGRILSGLGAPEDEIAEGGEIIHEVGTARMGESDVDSVVNSYGRVWDVPRLIVSDGSIFASKAHKNPTLTIMALAWRNADQITVDMKRGDL